MIRHFLASAALAAVIVITLYPPSAIASFAVGSSVGNNWGDSARGFSLGISSNKTSYKPGEPIEITVTMRYAGGNSPQFELFNDPCEAGRYNVVATLPDGKALPGWQPIIICVIGRSKDIASLHPRFLAPNEVEVESFTLNKFYPNGGLPTSGEFLVSAERSVRLMDNSALVSLKTPSIRIQISP